MELEQSSSRTLHLSNLTSSLILRTSSSKCNSRPSARTVSVVAGGSDALGLLYTRKSLAQILFCKLLKKKAEIRTFCSNSSAQKCADVCDQYGITDALFHRRTIFQLSLYLHKEGSSHLRAKLLHKSLLRGFTIASVHGA